jgi:hypothetical protein
MMNAAIEISATVRYRRQIRGADFTLEANTEAVPHAGRFYVLRDGVVEACSEDFAEVAAVYDELCREHWRIQIDSADAPERLASAWGLLGLEPENSAAANLIREEGSAQDRKRLEQIRRRQMFAKRRTARAEAA